MGILDFVKKGVQEISIARPDATKDMLVYKHPDPTIPNYAQLTIDADDAALFLRDGSVVGTLRTAGAGQRHTLTTQNIPFLSNLVDSATGGNLFTTDLFFITMRPMYNVPFGGPLGYMEDPLLGEMITPRIFGTFSYKVVDPEALVLKYLGVRVTTVEEQEKWIKGLFMNSVKSVLGNVCVAEQKSILELMPMQEQLAELFTVKAPELNEIGIEIVKIGDFNINLTPQDEKTLRAAQAEIGQAKRDARKAKIAISQAEAEAAQRQFKLDQDFQNDARYVQALAGGNYGSYAAGKAMIGAGEGMAKGGGQGGGGGDSMMGGAGLGVGFGMAQAMAQGLAGAGQNQNQGGAAQAKAPAGPVDCPSCNATVPSGKFCAECGSTLNTGPKFCSACGVQATAGAKFCAECGTSFPA